MTQSSLHFVSWNTNGIKTKCSKVLEILRNLHADVAFIQETHIGIDDDILEDVKGWRSYFTVYSPLSKGVAILIRDSVPFEYICNDEDYSGGYIVLFCKLHGEQYTLVNVYNHKADKYVLSRLKEYLMETAKGLLVVGGDFNTVLHPSFDRLSPSMTQERNSLLKDSPVSMSSLEAQSIHSRLKGFLEDFTVGLNLRDIWSYKHPAEEGFTRQQNESQSRLDMFFLPEHKIERVANINVQNKDAELKDVSDHFPLVLELSVQFKTKANTPMVLTYTPDRRPWNISGAEILSAIKSLTDFEEYSLNNNTVKYFKKHRCKLSETLKSEYNSEIMKRIGHTFDVNDLILSHILVKRLSEPISPIFKEKVVKNLDPSFTVTFEKGPQTIKWSFLKRKLENLQDELKKPDQISFALIPELSILDYLLPKEKASSELRLLMPGCPLTKFIFSLALNELETLVEINFCDFTVCYHSQFLCIYPNLDPSSDRDFVNSLVETFEERSGLKILTEN